jgi:hypothetical protein
MATSDRAATGSVSVIGATARTEDLALRRERRIADYQAGVRQRVAAMVHGAPQIEDLADSFPALLFALATGYNAGPARDRAIVLTLDGACLKEIADTLGLAMWLKRLPAAAFTELIPKLPGDAEFGLRLGSFVPTERRRAQGWLSAVSEAYLAGGREFALWMARNWSTLAAAVVPTRAGLIPAWYWYSSQPGTMAHELLLAGWDPRRSTSATADDVNAWIKRVALVEWLGTGTLKPWIADAEIGVYAFEALRRVEDFILTAAELDNCLEQFAGRLANGTSMVARIRRSGKTVACIEVGQHEIDPTMPAIIQLRGHKNARVPAELWRKAYDWISHAPIEPFSPERLTPPPVDRMHARERLWGHYIAALDTHADPAGKVVAQRLKRTLLPRIKPIMAPIRPPVGLMAASAARHTSIAPLDDDRQPTMLQRVREHIATLAGFPQADHELLRWDAVERLEQALRGRGRGQQR